MVNTSSHLLESHYWEPNLCTCSWNWNKRHRLPICKFRVCLYKFWRRWEWCHGLEIRMAWRWLLHSQFKLSFDLTPKVHLINFTFCLWFQVIFSSRACQLYGHLKPLLSIQWEVPLLNFQPRLKVQCVTKCSHPPFPSP